jgi:5-methylcytosine-specific restriction endonuclease McrA
MALKKRDALTGSIYENGNGWRIVFYDLETGKPIYRHAKSRERAEQILDSLQPKTEEERLILAASAAEYRRSKPKRGTVGVSVRFIIMRRDGYACRLCGRSASDGAKLHVDHKRALANGGTDEHKNLWTLCHECNYGKKAKDLQHPKGYKEESDIDIPPSKKEMSEIWWESVKIRAIHRHNKGEGLQ